MARWAAPNYGGPRIATTRYEKVRQCHRFSQTRTTRSRRRHWGGSWLGGPCRDRQGRTVCVFNPLGTARHDLVTIEASLPPQWAMGPIPRQRRARRVPDDRFRTHADGSLKSLRLLALADVPPLGYKTYSLTPAAPPPALRPPARWSPRRRSWSAPSTWSSWTASMVASAASSISNLTGRFSLPGMFRQRALVAGKPAGKLHALRGRVAGRRDGAVAGHGPGAFHHRPRSLRMRDQPLPRRQTRRLQTGRGSRRRSFGVGTRA